MYETVHVRPVSDNTPEALASGTLEPQSGERFYRVQVPRSLGEDSDVVYFEIDVGSDGDADTGSDAIALRLYTEAGNIAASSGSPDGFSTSDEAAESFGPRFLPQAIGTQLGCIGPCIIWPSNPGYAFISLENRLEVGGELSYTLYAYVEDFQDSNEPFNDRAANAVTITGSDYSGAIETLGDVDYWRAPSSGTLFFDTDPDSILDLRAELIGDPLEDPIAPGGSLEVVAGDLIRVFSASRWAGPPAASNYFLELR